MFKPMRLRASSAGVIAGLLLGSIVSMTAIAPAAAATYNVTFHSNFGASVTETQTATSDSATVAVTLRANTFVRTGYQFAGWALPSDTATVVYNDQAAVSLTGNLSLYAVWRQLFTVTYGANGGSFAVPPETRTASVPSGADALSVTYLPAPPIRIGHHLRGWDTDTAGAPFSSYQTFANATLLAQWAIDTYTVTVNASAGGAATASTSTVNYGGSDTLTAIASAGYVFAGWTCTAAPNTSLNNPLLLTNITSNTNCTANFAPITASFPLVVTVVGSGTVTPSSGAYAAGTLLTLSATPASGFTFVGWSGDCAGMTCTLLMGNARNVTATFASTAPITVTAAASAGGTASVSAATVNYGGRDTFTATASAGYHFVSWTCTPGTFTSTSNPLVLTNITSASTCTANFALNAGTVPLIVTIAGSGTVTPANGAFATGSSVTLTAIPASGWLFAGWSGACAGTVNALIVTMTAARACTATFVQLQAVPSGTFSADRTHRSRVSWQAALNATSYVIAVNGTEVCQTKYLACYVPRLLGPTSQVSAIAVSGSLRGSPTVLKYESTGRVLAFRLHFGYGSASLSTRAKAVLRQQAVRLSALGFTQVRIAGFVDNRERARYGNRLAQMRSKAAVAYLRANTELNAMSMRLNGPTFRNSTFSGRAANRRADGYVL